MSRLSRLLAAFYRRAPAGATPAEAGRTARGQRLVSIRDPVDRPLAIVLGIVPPLLTLLAWWLITRGDIVEERMVSPLILPSPGEVLASLPALVGGKLFSSIAKSLQRVAFGFGIAAAIALPMGIAMGAFGRVRALLGPLAGMGSYLPIAAVVPLTLSWFGIGELQKVMFLALASFFFILPLVVKAMDDVDAVYVNTAFTLGASPWQVVRKVLVAVALPDLYDALRLTFAVGWTYIILAEVVDAERGLGALIIAAQRRGPREHIYLVLVVIMAIAFVVDLAFRRAAPLLFPHRFARR